MTKRSLTDTDFWNEIMHGVYGPRSGGAKILIDAKDAGLGAGKTTCAVALGKAFARAFGYEMVEDDLTLSAAEYLQRYREHPDNQPSVLILDELVGAGGGDARRSMATKNVNLGRAWQLQRTKQVITICTLPSWSDADKRLRKLADYRCLCFQKPIGTFRPYSLGTFDFDEGSKIKFNRLDNRISFPKMDDDPLYQYLSDRKDDLIHSAKYDADELIEEEETPEPEEVRKEQKKQTAQRLRNKGLTGEEIGEVVGYSRDWVYKHTSAPPDEDDENQQEAIA